MFNVEDTDECRVCFDSAELNRRMYYTGRTINPLWTDNINKARIYTHDVAQSVVKMLDNGRYKLMVEITPGRN